MITSFDLIQIQARLAKNRGDNLAEYNGEGVECEAELHEQIIYECRGRLWPFVRSRMDLPSTTSLGAPDFVIAADNGRVFFIEAKTKTGKQSPAQIGWQMMLERNGHKYHLVRSFEQFLEAIKQP